MSSIQYDVVGVRCYKLIKVTKAYGSYFGKNLVVGAACVCSSMCAMAAPESSVGRSRPRLRRA